MSENISSLPKNVSEIPERDRERLWENAGAFVLDSEQLDAIRMETQSVSPAEQEKFSDLVVRMNNVFLNRFPYLQKYAYSDAEIRERFILVDPQVMIGIGAAHLPESKSTISYTENHGQFRVFIKEGDFAIGMFERNEWEHVPAQLKSELIQRLGDESQARLRVSEAIHETVILHELTHIYQSPGNVPFWLKEAQAFWIGREFADHESERIEAAIFNKTEENRAADFYQRIVNAYGDEVQHFCLSRFTYVTKSIEKEISNDYETEAMQKIFPDYKRS